MSYRLPKAKPRPSSADWIQISPQFGGDNELPAHIAALWKFAHSISRDAKWREWHGGANLPPLTFVVVPAFKGDGVFDEFFARNRLRVTVTDPELGHVLNSLTLKFENMVPLGLVVEAFANAVERAIQTLALRHGLSLPPARPTISEENEFDKMTALLDSDHYLSLKLGRAIPDEESLAPEYSSDGTIR